MKYFLMLVFFNKTMMSMTETSLYLETLFTHFGNLSFPSSVGCLHMQEYVLGTLLKR